MSIVGADVVALKCARRALVFAGTWPAGRASEGECELEDDKGVAAQTLATWVLIVGTSEAVHELECELEEDKG